MRFTIKLLGQIMIFTMLIQAVYAYDLSDLRKFERTNNCINCDLSSFDFRGEEHQNANLTGSNLSNTALSHDNTRVNFSEIKGIEALFCWSNSSEANFSYANLENAVFSGANLTSANFTGANVKGADFEEANMYGAIISADQLASARSVCQAILPDGSTGQCVFSSKKKMNS